VRTLAVLIVAACSSGSATPQQAAAPPPPKPIAMRDARGADADLTKLDAVGVYQALCSPCHGADAKGYKADHAPSLVNATFLESATDDFVHRSIALGRPGTSMAAYGKPAGGPLEDAQIDQLVAWLRAQGTPAQPLPAAAKGDAKRGAPIYEKSCQKCHGTSNTRGDAVHLANSRFLEMATDSFVRWAVVKGRPGTPMEPFAGKLSDRDIDDVVAYVRGFNTAHVEGQLAPPTGKESLVINPKGKDPSFTLKEDKYVPADQLKKALDDKRKLIIVDARPASEWMRAHLANAVSIPYLDMKRLDEVPKDVWVVTYCACPHHLSGIVMDELRRRGHTKSAVLDEGILEWHRRGYPMVVAPGVEPPPKEAVPPPR
jgi:mono/diheme cytochrome c family protein/rhodanese-related sulfurtransferase